MKIEMFDINLLKPYDKNPRKNDSAVEAVANSIREFGFKVPIIIDKENTIIAGHTRYKASLELGLTEVPCIVADDLTPKQIKAFRLADNKTAELAEWDFDLLLEELSVIDFDMEQFGFENILEEKEVEEDDYEVIEPEEPQAQLGDVYQLGNHRLMCGDSTMKNDVEKLMDGVQVDLVVTDPPYNVDYEGKAGKIINDKQKDEEFYNFLSNAFNNMFEATKEGGGVYVFHADTEGVNFRNAFQNAGYKLASCLIWVKNSFVFGRQDYHWRHEPILYGWREGKAHFFIDDRTQDTVLEYDKPRENDLHPTMKPLELISKLIKNSSRQKEVVLDLFGGSGTTLMTCEQLNRSCYMMEFDPKYVDVIIDRWETYTGRKAVKIK